MVRPGSDSVIMVRPGSDSVIMVRPGSDSASSTAIPVFVGIVNTNILWVSF